MAYEIIKTIIIAVITAVVTLVPTIIKWVQSVKAYKNAKTEADKEKALNDMQTMAQSFIQTAESAFAGFDTVMKAQGSSAGTYKKENVMSKLQSYALQNGYEFDAEYWSNKIDEIVEFTHTVNSKKKTV